MVQIERVFLHKKNKTKKALREENNILKVYAISMTILCYILGLLFIINNNNLIYKNKETVLAYETNYQTLLTDYTTLKNNYNSVSKSMKELAVISGQLEKQNESLVASNEDYYNQLCILKKRSELFDKYEYAIIDRSENRTDITYDQLVKIEDLIKESNIPDEDLILAWIMVESTGQEKAQNPNSTAKGFGQILNGTGKFIYTDLLNRTDIYNPNVALDGDTNIEMMIAYINYLYEENNGDLYEMIKDYSGSSDITNYVCKLDSYLSEANTSVKEISLSMK